MTGWHLPQDGDSWFLHTQGRTGHSDHSDQCSPYCVHHCTCTLYNTLYSKEWENDLPTGYWVTVDSIITGKEGMIHHIMTLGPLSSEQVNIPLGRNTGLTVHTGYPASASQSAFVLTQSIIMLYLCRSVTEFSCISHREDFHCILTKEWQACTVFLQKPNISRQNKWNIFTGEKIVLSHGGWEWGISLHLLPVGRNPSQLFLHVQTPERSWSWLKTILQRNCELCTVYLVNIDFSEHNNHFVSNLSRPGRG